MHGGQEDFLHAALRRLGGVAGVGGDGAHAAGVQALVVVQRALVIHAGHHGADDLAIGKGQHGNLRALQEFLNHHTAARRAKGMVLHHGAHGLQGLVPVGAQNHALAQGQTVGLHHKAAFRLGVQVADRPVIIVEGFVSGGGNAVFLHQVLGEHLAALDDGGLLVGAEGGNARLPEHVHQPQAQRIIRGHHHIVHLLLLAEGGDARHIGGLEGHQFAQGGHAAVAGRGIELRDSGVFRNPGGNGMLASAAAHNEYLHILSSAKTGKRALSALSPKIFNDGTAACG